MSGIYEQGVITLLFLSLLKLLLDGIYAVLPDWDIQAQLATVNQTVDIPGGAHYGNRPPWEIVLHFASSFNVIFPIREMYQLIVFAIMGYGFCWAAYYLWKFIKTLRGSG